MSTSTIFEAAQEPLRLDLTMDELMDQLDPGWVRWAQRGATDDE